MKDDFTLVSVKSTAPPEPMVGDDWYRYTIRQGANIIRGYQQGSLDTVRQSVEDHVARLNERRLGTRKNGPSKTNG